MVNLTFKVPPSPRGNNETSIETGTMDLLTERVSFTSYSSVVYLLD